MTKGPRDLLRGPFIFQAMIAQVPEALTATSGGLMAVG
jgi:hypothetical protein